MYLLEGNVKCENCCCGLPDLLNPPEDEVDHPGELLALLLRQQPRRAPTCCQDGHTVTTPGLYRSHSLGIIANQTFK